MSLLLRAKCDECAPFICAEVLVGRHSVKLSPPVTLGDRLTRSFPATDARTYVNGERSVPRAGIASTIATHRVR